MANTTFNIPRAHLIMALCLPLAVLLGYVLAEPFESGSVAVVVFVLVILSVPLLMKWHHPMLILSWNAVVNPVFLPGRAALWLPLSVLCLLFAIINRATNPDAKLMTAPSITRALLLLAAVISITGFLTGGFGSRFLGSSQFGGRKYYYLLGAIIGYFALASRRIPAHRASLYTAFFFLSGLTALIGHLAFLAGPGSYFLFAVFSPDFVQDQATASFSLNSEMVRLSGFILVAPAIYCWLLSRYGLRGVLDLSKPWRLLLLVVAIACGLFCGFRSVLVMVIFTCGFLFLFEGLHRTKYLFAFAAFAILTAAFLIPFANKLPLSAQRTLSVLPLHLSPIARQSADASSEWRIQMWKVVIPEIPKYLFKGKGYALDPREVAETQIHLQGNESWNGAFLMGDYHNGPLSLLIPFGIYGALAFLWFLFVSLRAMSRYLRLGDPNLRTINALLLATFSAKVVMFFFVFGSLHSDMAFFTGLLGLSVALNGPEPVSAPAEEREATEFDPDLNPGLSPSP